MRIRTIYNTHAGYTYCTSEANSPWWGTSITASWLCVVCKQSVLPLVVRYIKLIYSWSVHPARRRRTHSITVTVRSAIVWPVLVHLRVIVYQLAVRAKHKGGTRANPDDWLKVGEIFFRASRGRIGATRLCALPSTVPVPIQNCFLLPCTVSAPPFNIPRSAPVQVDLHCHWLNCLEEFN